MTTMAMSVEVRSARYEAQEAYRLWLTHGIMRNGFSASKSHQGMFIYVRDGYRVLMRSNGAIVLTTKEK